jgi:CDP-diacylglycerol--serine O-phosphatidyltransferase
MKKTYPLLVLIPNLFTISSIFCGFYAILHATSTDAPHRFTKAAVAIIFAVLFDMFDGRAARATRTESAFGVQMDSLADVISFGLAPAVLAYKWSLEGFGLTGLAAAFVFCVCGALRLARFNVLAAAHKTSKYFLGMPIPLAAGNISALVLLHSRAGIVEPGPRPLVLVLVLLLAALMISSIHYPAFKKTSPRQITFAVLLLAALALIAAFKTGFALMFSLVIFTVSLIGPVRELVVLFCRLHRPRPAIEKDRTESEE